MKGYYIYNSEYDYREHSRKMSGIDKKVQMHVDTFNEAGLNCELLFSIHVLGGFWVKIASRLPFGTDHVIYPDVKKLQDADWVYVRRPYMMGYHFRRFLKQIRKQTPNAKIVLEIPTYPYDEEISNEGIKNYPILWRDRFNRKRLKGLIDRIAVVPTPEERIWDIPVLHIMNGIRVNDIPMREPRSGDGTINVICAASFAEYHGIDRMLRGIQIYYANGGTRNIQLHLAGRGAILEQLRITVKGDETLCSHVCFLGHLDKEELIRWYSACNLGISTLGMHRLAPNMISGALKTREYLATGLPFFGDADIDVFIGKEIPFYLKLPQEDRPVDICSVVEFYDKVYPHDSKDEKMEMAQRMREFARENVEMKNVMKEVIEYFQ